MLYKDNQRKQKAYISNHKNRKGVVPAAIDKIVKIIRKSYE
jgi:hypothetical protein